MAMPARSYALMRKNWGHHMDITNIGNMTLGNLFHECAQSYQDAVAVTMAPCGTQISYTRLEQQINQFAHGFLARFPEKQDYVGIMLENSIDYLVASYALKKIDVVEVAINRAFRGAALSRMINLTDCEIVITSAAHLQAIQDVSTELTSLKTLIVLDDVRLAAEMFPHLTILPFAAIPVAESAHIASTAKPTDTAVIMFTSGTTGISKGCVLSHRYAIRTAENMIAPYRLTAEDINYTPYPLSHIGPAFYDILPSWITGGSVILRDGFSLSNFWPEISKFGGTWFMCLGSVQQLLYNAPPRAEEKQHKVTRCWSTPAPIPKDDFESRFGLHLIPGGGYGSTDAGWVVVPQWDHPGGKVLPHFDVQIVDEDDAFLPANHVGEIVIRPHEAGVMSDGYFGMPEKTNETRRNLWFHTGDLGWLDEEGLFYFKCRMAERIRVRGEMVSGFEVEEGVLAHPAIQDAAAIGVPSEFGEEDVFLFLTQKPGHALSEAEIISHCRGVMAKFMVPKYVVTVDEMPRTPTGKPEKGKLKEMAMTHLTSGG